LLHDKNIEYEIIFVNDGSLDNTLDILISYQKKYNKIAIIDLTRNFGKEAALTAGLNHATGNIVIPIDVDLQDPVELIPDMIQKWKEGFDVVLCKRIDRTADSFFKRTSATLFYKISKMIFEIELPENVGDFRLMDKKVIEALKMLPERKRFMKGLFAWLGFKVAEIEFVRHPRLSGTSKFNFWKLWNFAWEGITSFSTFPLRIWTYIGFLIALFSIFYGFFTFIKTLIEGVITPGYASIMIMLSFIGGLLLMGLGIIGEYLGRIYQEVKMRPIYLIRNIYESGIKTFLNFNLS
jgi:glycosyltransferase involved in cell wall biosynthesis